MRMLLKSTLIVGAILFQPLSAQEYFGQFPDAPKVELISAGDSTVYRLLQEFVFVDPNGLIWSVPETTKVDGASIPRVFWSFIGGPFSGKYVHASIIHDYYCCKKSRAADHTHRTFYFGMRAKGVSLWKSKLMYWAVSVFGPQWHLAGKAAPEQGSLPARKAESGGSESQHASRVVAVDSVNLEDPKILAAALVKFGAVARTLRTSNGEILDVSASGPVIGALDSVRENADAYRRLFSADDFGDNEAELGLLDVDLLSRMSSGAVSDLDDFANWPQDKIPSLDSTPSYEQWRNSLGGTDIGIHLERGELDDLQYLLEAGTTDGRTR